MNKIAEAFLVGATVFALGIGVAECVTVATKSPTDAVVRSRAACSKLEGWGCPIGKELTCPQAFQLPPSFGISAECVLDAGRVEDLGPCGVRCPQ